MNLDEIIKHLELERDRITRALEALQGNEMKAPIVGIAPAKKPRKTPKPGICKVCGKTGHNARRHKGEELQSVDGKGVQCLDCREERVFPSKALLNAHREREHGYNNRSRVN